MYTMINYFLSVSSKQKMQHATRRFTTKCLACLLLVLPFLNGCVLSPRDGIVVNNFSGTISGVLVANEPNSTITLSSHAGYYWEDLLSVTTTTADRMSSGGEDYFVKFVDIRIPSSSQRPGKTGFYARLKGKVVTPSGEEWNLTTFKDGCYVGSSADVVECAADHPGNVYIYTRDFPRVGDLVVQSIRIGSRGIDVRVWNGGRDITLDKIQCSVFGRHLVKTINQKMAPGAIGIHDLGLVVSPGQTVTCTAFGIQADGSREPIDVAAAGDNQLRAVVR